MTEIDSYQMRTYLCGKRESVDFIERYNCHAFLEPAILQKVLPNTFILDDDVVQFTTCGDLKCCCLMRVFGRDRSQSGNETFDFAAVESGVGRCVVKGQVRETVFDGIACLQRTVSNYRAL